MYDIRFKGESALAHGVYVAKRPSVPAPTEDVTTYIIGGRDGVLTGDRRLLPLEITVEMGFREAPDSWMDKFREIRNWLSGSGELILSDDSSWYYKVLYLSVNNLSRNYKRYGAFEAVFTCDPYVYRVDGLIPKTVSYTLALQNDYETCHPEYIVSGTGERTVTVNGESFVVNASGIIVIDTERMISYQQSNGHLVNSSVTGDYEDLYLVNGTNNIQASESMTVIPHWRSK